MITDTEKVIETLYTAADETTESLHKSDVAHLVIHENKVIGSHLVPGLTVDVEELDDGIRAYIRVKEGAIIPKPVQICFGMLPEDGVQRVVMDVVIEDHASVSILAHCVFPNAVNLQHIMDAKIRVGNHASYTYHEKHVHGKSGGIVVVPKATVELGEESRFKTEFDLIKGRVGKIDIQYETTCQRHSVMEMTARVNGTGDDHIKISEIGHLVGEGARGVLTSRIAVRDNATAHVYNKLTADAPFARGHVDCQEIIQDNGKASAVPIVEVNHPKAHVTHEAAIGSVDNKQLETLMSRGLSEDDAVDMIIDGLLR